MNNFYNLYKLYEKKEGCSLATHLLIANVATLSMRYKYKSDSTFHTRKLIDYSIAFILYFCDVN